MEGNRAGGVCWGQTTDVLSDVLRSFNFSSIGSEATTGRFSWTSDELMLYVRPAAWATVREMSEMGKGLETGR